MDAVRVTLLASALAALGAGYRTTNFVVQAPTPALARQIGDEAERFRRELAVLWTGKEMPSWSQRCPITAEVRSNLGAGGATTFLFDRGEVYGWRMTIQGSRERILDSVLPHEVTHTIFASHFRQAVPRWADEGACTTVEHASERAKQEKMLIEFLTHRRGISFSQMFAMKEYPPDVMPLYSQGHSVARFLIAQGGHRKFLEFVGDGLNDENWPGAIQEHYGHANLLALQNAWLDWVSKGSPDIQAPKQPPPTLLAQAKPRKRPSGNLIYRGQSADRQQARPAKIVPVRRGAAAAADTGRRGDARSQAGPAPESAANPAPQPARRPAAVNWPAEQPVAPERSPAAERNARPEPAATAFARGARTAADRTILEWSRTATSPPERALAAPRQPVYDASLHSLNVRR